MPQDFHSRQRGAWNKLANEQLDFKAEVEQAIRELTLDGRSTLKKLLRSLGRSAVPCIGDLRMRPRAPA